MNPNFRRIRADYENEPSTKTSSTSNASDAAGHHNGSHEFQSSHLYDDKRKLASEHDGNSNNIDVTDDAQSHFA